MLGGVKDTFEEIEKYDEDLERDGGEFGAMGDVGGDSTSLGDCKTKEVVAMA